MPPILPPIDGHYYQYDLCWIVNQILAIKNQLEADRQQLESQGADIAEIQGQIKTLENAVTSLQHMIETGNFPQDALINWANTYLPGLVASIVKYFFFGLSDDGHFIAMIPDSWQFIRFDTIVDPTSELYGHLVLNW